jgi:hypothetical protein
LAQLADVDAGGERISTSVAQRTLDAHRRHASCRSKMPVTPITASRRSSAGVVAGSRRFDARSPFATSAATRDVDFQPDRQRCRRRYLVPFRHWRHPQSRMQARPSPQNASSLNVA